jgi:hypothetical protein
MAQKMGAGLGSGKILLGSVPQRRLCTGEGRGRSADLICKANSRKRTQPRPVRLEAQDTALSRRRQGFESPTGRQTTFNILMRLLFSLLYLVSQRGVTRECVTWLWSTQRYALSVVENSTSFMAVSDLMPFCS